MKKLHGNTPVRCLRVEFEYPNECPASNSTWYVNAKKTRMEKPGPPSLFFRVPPSRRGKRKSVLNECDVGESEIDSEGEEEVLKDAVDEEFYWRT